MGKLEDNLIAGGFGLGQILDQISLIYAQGNEGLTRSGELGFADSQQRYQKALQEAAIKESQRKAKKERRKALPRRIAGTVAQVGLGMTPAAPVAGSVGSAIAGSQGTYAGGGGLQKAFQPQPVGGTAPFLEGALSSAPSAFGASSNSVAAAPISNFAAVAPQGYDINAASKRGFGRLY